ncbi:AAA-like domain-containing protein [Chamaesiphon polymorphus]|uniref:AAA-like domain-containing protein n=1 Tax=Chamaesiphon polymorphus TaxID=2107691 RepID=UPI003183D273
MVTQARRAAIGTIAYKIGGSLPANAPTYVVRSADRDLDRYIDSGEFCYILNSRQMGKSSLKLRAMQKLADRGVACIEIDLAGIGTVDVSEAQWYNSIADELASQFDLDAELEVFWDTHARLPASKRLANFIDEIVLEQIDSQIVIFIDEIDQVLSLGAFTDNFFGTIRSCAERRAARPKYQRLSFVLLGVAAPTDLIKDRQITPFNIGRAIELNGLQLTDDLSPLIRGLDGIVADPSQTITEILDWTGGQPFLTQKLCQLVVESPHEAIEQIVTTKIIDNWKERDNPVHLRTIEARILARREISSHLLQQYRYIITSKSGLVANNSPEQQWLRLSGLVVERSGKLQVYNPIYQQVFSRDWIDRQLADICPHGKALTDWLNNDRSDTFLLDGDALDAAISWKEFQWRQNQLIGIEDTAFIDRSQERRTDWKLKKIQNRIKRFVKILLLLIGIGLILLASLIWLGHSLTISDRIDRLERTSTQIIQQYEFAPIDSLQAAIENAKKSQAIRMTLMGDRSPTIGPKLALQKLVDSIQEIDEIQTYQQGVNTVYFCGNDRIFTAGSDGTIKLWDRTANIPISEPKLAIALQDEAKIISFTSENPECDRMFATGSSDGYIRLWEKLGIDRIQNKAKVEQAIAHQGSVQNVRLMRDLRDDRLYVFSTGETDGKLKKWQVDDNNRLNLIKTFVDRDGNVAHPQGVVSLNLNGKKDRIGSAGKDNTAKIWDLDGNPIAILEGHIGAVNSIYFCSSVSTNCDDYEIATGSSDGTVRLWNADGKYLKTINAHTGEVRTVRFSPDGKLLATASAKDPTASNGSSVRIWNLEDDGKLITEFKGHQGSIESMRFKPSNNLDRQLATSGRDDSIIRIWKIPEVMPSEHKHKEKINSVRFDPYDSKYFITAGEDGKIAWWSHSPGQLPQQLSSFSDRDKAIKFNTIRIHPNSTPNKRTIAVGDSQGNIRLLKLENEDGKQKIIEVSSFNTGQGNVDSMDWNYKPYGDLSNICLLATTGQTGDNIKFWAIDINENKLLDSIVIPPVHLDYSHLTLRFSKDGKSLGVGADKGRVAVITKIERPTQRPQVKQLKYDREKALRSKVIVGFSKDPQLFTIVSKEGKIWRSEIETNLIEDEKGVQTYQAGTENIDISSQDGSIATGGAGAALRIWDVRGRQLADFRGYWGTIRSINFSRDGKYLLAGGDDGIPLVWQIDRQIPDLIEQANRWLAR